MLKRNLIAIAIVGLAMVSSAFAQDGVRGKRPSRTNPEIKRNEVIVKPTTATVNEITMDGTKVYGNEVEIKDGRRGSSSETSRTSRNNQSNSPAGWLDGSFDIAGIQSKGIVKTSAKSKGTSRSTKRRNPAPFSITEISTDGVKKPKSVKGQTEYVDNDEYRTKNPRNRTVRKPKSKNLGDTGTHEVGHKQKRSTQKRQHKP